MKKKIILKSSILAVAAGLSVFAINSVFADELPVREKYYFVKEFSKNCNCIKYGDNAMKEFFLRIVSIC